VTTPRIGDEPIGRSAFACDHLHHRVHTKISRTSLCIDEWPGDRADGLCQDSTAPAAANTTDNEEKTH